MVAASVAVAEKPSETCVYTSVKMDATVLRIAKAVANLQDKTIQEYLSDVINVDAADYLGRQPVKRLPPPKHGGKREPIKRRPPKPRG